MSNAKHFRILFYIHGVLLCWSVHSTTPTEVDEVMSQPLQQPESEYSLEFCVVCQQMTNHNEYGTCLKHDKHGKGMTNKTPEDKNVVYNALVYLHEQEHIGDDCFCTTEISGAYRAILEEIERQKSEYIKSVFRDRAKTNPDTTFAEFWERHYNQKHDYRGAELESQLKEKEKE